MSTYTRLGQYILTELVQELSYGSLFRAVKTQGLAYLEHVHVLKFNEDAVRAGIYASIDRHRDWIEAFEGIRKVDSVAVIDIDDEKALVLPYFRGRSLAAMMHRNAEDRMVRLEHILMFALDLATILASLNSAGLVHGAVSLDSTWVDIDGHIRELDAPLGKVILQADQHIKAFGPMAPHKRQLKADFANDLESFGLILFYLISGNWPNRSSLDASVDSLAMTHEEWGDQEVIPIPEAVKDVVRRSIQGGYSDGPAFLSAVKAAYDHPDCEPYNATTFGVAFLLSSLIRLDLPGELEALEIEKSYEFLEAVGEPRVIERERIVYQEDLRKKRRNIAIAVILAIAGLTGGGFALVRASRHRDQQEKIRQETENLVARYNHQVEVFKEEERQLLNKIANAQTAGEKQALLAQFEQQRQAHEAGLAAIRASIESLQKRQKALGGDPKNLQLPAASVGLPSPASEAVVLTPPTVMTSTTSLGSKGGPSETSAPAVNQRERVMIPAEAVPFSPSVKSPMGQEAGTPPSPGAPVYLTGTTRVEVLEPGRLSSVPSPAEAPTVAVRNQFTANQVRKIVIPQMDQSVLRSFEGQTVRIRVLVDPFGQAKAAAVETCPPVLAADFKAAAMKTQFNPLVENGRAKQGWIVLSYQVTGTGVSFDSQK